MIGKIAVESTISLAQMNMLFKMRTFWRDAAYWTRAYLISRFVGVGFNQEVFTKLYSLPNEISRILSLIFGNVLATEYMRLLEEHSILLRDYIEAAINGDINTVNEKYKSLYQNADERAKFLASINPFWDDEQWNSLFNTYLDRTIAEITTFLTGEYKTNLSIFESILAHTETMADYFSQGLYNFMTYNPSLNTP